MKLTRGAAGLVFLCSALALDLGAQRQPEVRRAQPADEAPAPPSRPDSASEQPSEPSAQAESPGQRQLDYANGLFGRKLYDIALPEFQKYLDENPNGPGRANAYFCLAECYRALNKEKLARTNFQIVIDKFGDSDFGGLAAYRIAETHFTQKEYNAALPLFHRAATKIKEPAAALSARYFEARCLEALDRKDEAAALYQQVIDAKNPNPYREDSRQAGGAILLARGHKPEAFKQFEALANEAQKPALKAEATVRAGLIASELAQPEKGKIDKTMSDKAASLLQKGRTLPEAGRWRSIAQIGLLRLQFQSGQFAQLLSDYKRGPEQFPEDVRAEVMLLAANSQRALGHTKEAEEIYQQIIAKYPKREEAKDAQYQRLINLYSSNAPSLLNEIDQFLATNPPAERADEVKLLKAEALYREQKYSDAAPLYSALRGSQLSPKLRAECAFRLGTCSLQMKNPDAVVEAFTFFLKNFPDNPQAPTAVMQRSLAFQELKNYNAALGDLDWLLGNFPAIREREAALNQKALILGQLNNGKAMADTFRQLLKEFPKSQWAAEANYFIGKATFDAKDYKGALAPLDTARRLNKEQYFDLATTRIVLALFYLQDRQSLTREVDGLIAANATAKIPAEVLEALGLGFYNEKNFNAAEKYLGALAHSGNIGNVKPDFWFYLGDTESKLKNFGEAENALQKYVEVASDPAAKAKALLTLGATKISAHKPDDAQKIADEIMTLQPEGRVNAEARLLAGDVQVERARFEEAAKAFLSVALLYDDPTITPRALQKAALAFTKAGNKGEADRIAKELHDRYPGYAGG